MPRSILIFALCLPLAILMGYMLSDPLMSTNMLVIGTVVALMLFPLAIAMHHRMLIWLAPAFVTAFFIKGQPEMWMLIACVSFGLSVLSRPLAKVKPRPVWERGVAGSLVVLLLVVFITMTLRGGIGLKVLGSEIYGGRRYISAIAAIVGFFALTLQALPRKTAQTDLTIFTLAPITAAVSNIAYMLGPYFYFLFLLFPVDLARGQAAAESAVGLEKMSRIVGFGPACIALICFALFRWGFTGLMDIRKPWRLGIVVLAVSLGLYSGFRSALVVAFLVCAVQFFAEGLHKTKNLFIFLGAAILSFGLLAAFSERLPLSAQRALSFLPIRVDPVARVNAAASTQWRLEMWSMVVKDIPKYLLLGKGYGVDPGDLFFVEEGIRRGFNRDYEFSLRAGDYHNGPLSVILPLGLGGFLAFYSFLFFCIRVLWRNLKFGDPELRKANTLLFSLFLARAIFFTFLFGALEADLWVFCSIAGLSLALNHGVRQPAFQKQKQFVRPKAEPRLPRPSGPSGQPGLLPA